MRYLHPLLRDRNIDGVRQASLATAAVIFGVLNVIVLQNADLRDVQTKAATVLLSALSLAVLAGLVQRLFLMIWAQPVLGEWIYRSSSGNWGLARIDLRGGELSYSVQLYRTEQDAQAAVRGEPGFVTRCFATVSSVGVTYEKGQVELIYKISDAHEDYATRSGMLTLRPLRAGAMKGYWKSDILGAESSRGVLDMYRPNRRGA
ncbi:hypothetical protein OG777_22135 [Micromonospora peucetia]|uniref:SMODS-associating 2TM beta-strand rich effector domain-containing protein n=1 Tax=Micromonospora peucetia TaxID=47871 RepID=A0A1C6VCL1_9ACTN|nr:hypothetical protein [Micromonospora peucetia]MCX4389609.1 hypothetical protein [Micromonospora peucetia]WSA30091.1 hypothetical protein OIE14_17895 [Micromonospora peucetia]SCL64093.1 hypothetical protein GA0070608_2898 [Micromonospora peucetia]